jgi:hypothetical protein
MYPVEIVVMRTVLIPEDMDKLLCHIAKEASVPIGNIIRTAIIFELRELKELETAGKRIDSKAFADGKLKPVNKDSA